MRVLLDEVLASAVRLVEHGFPAPTVLELHPAQMARMIRMLGLAKPMTRIATAVGVLEVKVDSKVSEHSFMLR